MHLNSLKKFVKAKEKQAGFDKTDSKALIQFLEKEIKELKQGKKEAGNKIVDIIILALQLANRHNSDLDLEWKEHWNRFKKYLNRAKK